MGCSACAKDGSYYCDRCASIAASMGLALPTRQSPSITLHPPGYMDPEAPEGVLQGKLQKFCHDTGYLFYHTHDSRKSTPGWPDCAILHPEGGPLYLWELKDATSQPSANQRRWLDALYKATSVQAAVYRPEHWGEMMRILARGFH